MGTKLPDTNVCRPRPTSRLELDHYLELLLRKPGALPGGTVLEQARAAGKFTPVHDAWWAAARKARGNRDGTCALIEVLLLGRHLSSEHLVAGLAAALRADALGVDAVHHDPQKPVEKSLPVRAHARPSRLTGTSGLRVPCQVTAKVSRARVAATKSRERALRSSLM